MVENTVEIMNQNEQDAVPVEIGDTNFKSEVLKAKQPVVVAFWAPWSRPCHILDLALDEAAKMRAGIAKVVKVNADDNPDLSLLYDIQSVPTLLYFINGNLRAKLVGTATKEAILAKFDTCLAGIGTPSTDNQRSTT